MQYPEDLLDKVDDEIRRGAGAMSCMKFVQLNYSGGMVMPSRDSFEKYVAARREYFRQATERRLQAEAAMAALPPMPDMTLLHPQDRRQWLEATLRTLGERVEHIKGIQTYQEDPRYERILTDNLLAIVETIDKQTDLDKKLGFDRDRLQVVVKVLLSHISKAVGQAYKDVHGDDRYDAFLKALERRVDALSYDLIEEEVTVVVTETNTADVGGGKNGK